ncbi:sulfite exporter TauE/SafE family protein [Planctomycetota bacterium]
MPVPEWVILVVFCAAASVTQSVSGFGFGVVLVAVLPLFGLEIQRVVVLITLLVGINIGIALWRVRQHVSIRRVIWLSLGVPFGIPLGLMLLTAGREWEWVLRGLLGAVLVLAAVEPYFRAPAGEGPPERRPWALFAGFSSGVLGGALSSGGPPVVIYFLRRHWAKEVTKAAIMLVFAGNVLMRLVAYTIKGGLFTGPRLLEAALLVPVVVVASLVGERLFHAMSQGAFRRAVAAVIIVCGAYQIYRAVLLLA